MERPRNQLWADVVHKVILRSVTSHHASDHVCDVLRFAAWHGVGLAIVQKEAVISE